MNVTTDPTFKLVGIPGTFFGGNYHSSTTYHGGAEYDVSHDGTRFLMICRERQPLIGATKRASLASSGKAPLTGADTTPFVTTA